MPILTGSSDWMTMTDTSATPAPKLSVILPVRNEEHHIGRVLDELLGQSLPEHECEFLVVDGMSTDRTREIVDEIASRHPSVRLIDNPGCLSGRARNIGVSHATSPYVLFIDGHCRILSDFMLASVLHAFEGGARCISRPQPLMADPGERFQKAVTLARSTALGHYTGSEIYHAQEHWCSPLSAGCGYERGLYLELGGIDEDFDAAEDLEFNLRVERHGVEALHGQEFAVGYLARDSWLSLFRQLYRYGYGRARTARKHPASFSPLVGLLSFFVLMLGVLPLASVAVPVLGLLWIAVAAGYMGLVLASSVWGARSHPSLTIPVAGALTAIHIGGGLGYLMGLTGGPSWCHAPPKRPVAASTPAG